MKDLGFERQEQGFSARGPGLYVWGDDAREVLEWASELNQAVRSRRRGERIVDPGPDPSASCDPLIT